MNDELKDLAYFLTETYNGTAVTEAELISLNELTFNMTDSRFSILVAIDALLPAETESQAIAPDGLRIGKVEVIPFDKNKISLKFSATEQTDTMNDKLKNLMDLLKSQGINTTKISIIDAGALNAPVPVQSSSYETAEERVNNVLNELEILSRAFDLIKKVETPSNPAIMMSQSPLVKYIAAIEREYINPILGDKE